MVKLGRKAKAILGEVFFLCSSAPRGVEAAWFRAQREIDLDLLDELERDGFLRREEGRYLVSLTALPHIRHPLAREALDGFEKVFAALRDSYRAQLSKSVPVRTLAKSLGLEEHKVRVWLNYMVEGSWSSSRSSDLLGAEDATIAPAESILKWRRFRDVIKQLQEWQEQRLSDRKNMVPISQLRQNLPGIRRVTTNVDEVLVGRPKPDWYGELPDSMRDLLGETYSGMAHGLRALPAMGARAAIDLALTDSSPGHSRFSDRLEDLVQRGLISRRDADSIDAAIEAGHAATHRGHFPVRGDLDALLDVTEHFLRSIYVVPKKAQSLRQATPKRTKPKKKRP